MHTPYYGENAQDKVAGEDELLSRQFTRPRYSVPVKSKANVEV
jgi:hypothetical protein